MKRVSVSVLLAAITLLGITVPSAGAAEGEQHCYVRVIERKASGELVTTPPRCFATQDEATRSAMSGSGTRPMRGVTTQSSFVLATHYDAPNGGGTSTQVWGDDCLGGWLNTSTQWAGSMESTRAGCSRVRHFYNQNLSGTYQDAFSGTVTNLTSPLFHHAYSVQYTT
jgi:hypothetical protein